MQSPAQVLIDAGLRGPIDAAIVVQVERCHGAGNAGLRYDLRFLLVVARIQDVMFDFVFFIW